MPRKSRKAIKEQTVEYMTTLGNYKPEYEQTIDIYAGLIYQYAKLEIQWSKIGYAVSEDYTNKAGATNQRKVPILTVLESLRRDILSYSDRLRLNPKADSVELDPDSNKNNALAQFLSENGAKQNAK